MHVFSKTPGGEGVKAEAVREPFLARSVHVYSIDLGLEVRRNEASGTGEGDSAAPLARKRTARFYRRSRAAAEDRRDEQDAR